MKVRGRKIGGTAPPRGGEDPPDGRAAKTGAPGTKGGTPGTRAGEAAPRPGSTPAVRVDSFTPTTSYDWLDDLPGQPTTAKGTPPAVRVDSFRVDSLEPPQPTPIARALDALSRIDQSARRLWAEAAASGTPEIDMDPGEASDLLAAVGRGLAELDRSKDRKWTEKTAEQYRGHIRCMAGRTPDEMIGRTPVAVLLDPDRGRIAAALSVASLPLAAATKDEIALAVSELRAVAKLVSEWRLPVPAKLKERGLDEAGAAAVADIHRLCTVKLRGVLTKASEAAVAHDPRALAKHVRKASEIMASLPEDMPQLVRGMETMKGTVASYAAYRAAYIHDVITDKLPKTVAEALSALSSSDTALAREKSEAVDALGAALDLKAGYAPDPGLRHRALRNQVTALPKGASTADLPGAKSDADLYANKWKIALRELGLAEPAVRSRRKAISTFPVGWRVLMWEALSAATPEMKSSIAVAWLCGSRPSQIEKGVEVWADEAEGILHVRVLPSKTHEGKYGLDVQDFPWSVSSFGIDPDDIDGGHMPDDASTVTARSMESGISDAWVAVRHLNAAARLGGHFSADNPLTFSVKPKSMSNALARASERVLPNVEHRKYKRITAYDFRHLALADSKATAYLIHGGDEVGAAIDVAVFAGHSTTKTQSRYGTRTQSSGTLPGMSVSVTRSPRVHGDLQRRAAAKTAVKGPSV